MTANMCMAQGPAVMNASTASNDVHAAMAPSAKSAHARAGGLFAP